MARYEPEGKTFVLLSPGDYLEKIRWEFKNLTETDPLMLPDFLYRTVTCLSDIWHMCDWVYVTLKEHEVNGPRGIRQFRNDMKATCRELAICREIADAHKHSKIDSSPDAAIATRYILGPGPLRQAPTQWFIVDGDNWLDPREVAEGGLRFWIEFLGSRDFLKQTPLENIYRGEASLL